MSDKSVMQIGVTTEGKATVIALVGRLDIITSKAVREKLLEVIDGGAQHVVLDLSRLEYVSSAGLRVFLEGRKAIKGRGGNIVLSSVQPFIQNILSSTGFDTLFVCYDTVAAASAG